MFPQRIHVLHHVEDPRFTSRHAEFEVIPGHQAARTPNHPHQGENVMTCKEGVCVPHPIYWLDTPSKLTWWQRECSPVRWPVDGSLQQGVVKLFGFWPTSSSPWVPEPKSLKDKEDQVIFLLNDACSIWHMCSQQRGDVLILVPASFHPVLAVQNAYYSCSSFHKEGTYKFPRLSLMATESFTP